jgi:RimJ/RimL family protein N-acetyltransferase
MTPLPRLDTPRLRLRPAGGDDLLAWAALLAVPGLRRWMPPDASATAERAWAVTVGGRVIGRVGLSQQGLLNYWIASDQWGSGLATEAAHAVVCWALQAGGFEALEAAAHRDNRASQRVLEKLGFRFDGLVRWATPGDPLPWPVCRYRKRGAAPSKAPAA